MMPAGVQTLPISILAKLMINSGVVKRSIPIQWYSLETPSEFPYVSQKLRAWLYHKSGGVKAEMAKSQGRGDRRRAPSFPRQQ